MGGYSAAVTLLLLACSALTRTQAQEAAQLRNIVEPAILVVEPASPIHTQGGKLSFTCVAYGEPQLPTIIWSAPSLGVADFRDGSPDSSIDTNIYTSIYNDTDNELVFVISVLELCYVNYSYSFVNDFQCRATNELPQESSVGQTNYSSPFTMTPLVYEPASLLAAPSMGQFTSNGPRISATCAAYGSPRPSIEWTQNWELIVEDNYTNIYTESVVDEDGDILVISTLELCGFRFEAGPGETACTTDNGVLVDSEERVQATSFVIDPRVAIVMYTVQLLGDTAEFVVTFSAPLTLSASRCFFDKLMFANGANSSDDSFLTYQPLYPGICQDPNNTHVIVAYLDPRDFRPALDFFESIDSMNIISIPSMEVDFLPFTSLLPIRSPLRASQLRFNLEPRMESFDVDLNTDRVVLHFDDYMDLSTLDISQLVLANPESGSSLTLTAASLAEGVDEIVRTACITLGSEDLEALQNMSICTSIPDNCTCYFSPGLIATHSNVLVQGVLPSLPLPVSKLKFPSTGADPDLYMRLSLVYEGCSAVYNLTADEVYVLRDSETVTRVDCYSSGVMGNINPILSFDKYEGSLGLQSTPAIDLSYINFIWPDLASIAIPDGLPPENFGLYTCQTPASTIQNYIIDLARYLALPDGDTYTVRLYDSITIPFLLGSDPFINILGSDVEIALYDAEQGNPALIEPEYRKLSPYRGEVFYNYTLLSQTGRYSLRVVIAGDIIASAYLYIVVDLPVVSVVPPVLALLPGDTTVTMRCLTNSAALPVQWLSALDSTVLLGDQQSLTMNVPAQGGFLDGESFYCVVRNPELTDTTPDSFTGSARTVVQNINDELVVIVDGQEVEDFGYITVVNRFYGDLDLQCLGHAPSGVLDLVWIFEEVGRAPVQLQGGSQDNFTSAGYDYNVANLTIDNFIRPYRGTLRCQSTSSDRQITIFVTESPSTVLDFCDGGDRDPLYKIAWERTAVNSSDIKPCPDVNGRDTAGTAFRTCLDGNMWDSFVNVSNCWTPEFGMLRERANELFSLAERLDASVLNDSLTLLSNELTRLTAPSNHSLLSLDLNNTNYIVENTIPILPTDSLQSNVFDVLDNVLDAVNEGGWKDLDRIGEGSPRLLQNIEDFAAYVASAQPTSNTTITGENIIISTQGVDLSSSDVIFPDNSDPSKTEGQLRIPAILLRERQATGVANALIRNLPTFLPEPEPPKDSDEVRVVASVILSTQFISQEKGFFMDGLIELNYNTTGVSKAGNPECVFWNETTGKWDSKGVDTEEVKTLDSGEMKVYSVRCAAGHATAFAVTVDLETQEFDFTIPIYVGCGVVILSALVSIFTLFISCVTDTLRKYILVIYFTHMSVCISLICAFVGFLAGIELALENEIGCIATAAILHYFFTAAFSWILCQSVVIVFYPFCAKHCSSFVLVFLLGWTLPAIPTAISLGLIRDDYVTSQTCWFFFDGTVENTIVLSFLVPKLVIIAATLLFLAIGCITIQVRSSKQTKGIYIHMLRFTWFGVLLLLLLLALAWVFALLLVNVYGIDSSTAGWVFMGACIALAIWLFLFTVIFSVLSQNVDYEVIEDTDQGAGVKKKVRRRVKKKARSQRTPRQYEMMTPSPNKDNQPIEVDPAILENSVLENPMSQNPIAEDYPDPEDDDSPFVA